MTRIRIKCVSLLLIFSLIFNSCGSIKSAMLLSKAEVNTLKEKQTFKFENSFAALILTVKIKSNSYRFIFDTGAGATVISKELAKAIGIKEINNITVTDTHKAKQKLSVGYVDTISLGNLSYSHVGVLVNDMNKIPEIACLNIDGILGINAIKLNSWQIDYDNSTVTIYDINSQLLLPETFKPIDFKIIGGLPRTDFVINGIKENFLIDMGYSGSLSVSSKINLGKADASLVGYATTGLFGGKTDTTNTHTIKTFANSTLTYTNIFINQAKSLGSLIGNSFFQYKYGSIVFDFKNNKLFVQERNKTNDNTHLSYGFKPKLIADKIIVGAKYLNFSDDITNLSIGDTISELNSIPTTNFCDFIKEIDKSKNNATPITIKVLKNKNTISYTLPLKSIL